MSGTITREMVREANARNPLGDPRAKSDAFYRDLMRQAREQYPRQVGCGCACCFGGFCGGCGHAGCGGR